QKPTTEYYVIQTIRKLGHNVTIIPVDSLKTLAKQLKEQKNGLVFNLTEEFKGDRRKDKVITSLLENLKMPFTGADTAGLTICRDKILSKQILNKHKINVPDFLLFPRGKTVKIPKNIRFPMVVKPAFEDGSEGISNASVVNNVQALKKRVRFVTKKWKQPAIAEEFIKGREFYVGIIGNKKPIALPIRECIFSRGAKGPCLATYRVKWNEKYRKKWNVRFGFAKSAGVRLGMPNGRCLTALDKEITEKICETCKKAYKLLHLRDYGRIDLRLTPAGKVVILEVNANPDVAKGEDLAEAAKKAGITYKKFLSQIISYALARYR
ncbi:MAG: ATP-grasp domain-containing protein, partial [Phycisphaerae bacterium]|nr:ATP-grasp domain-containing protein [Phycisphaerae bacterium]